MKRIDLNCDLGESFGVYTLGLDEQVVPIVTSVNIACGYHAGDPSVMRRTVKLALKNGVAIGAHPGLPDLNGFGRRNIEISPEEAYDLVVKSEGGVMQHVKPHGALYNMAAKNAKLSQAIAEAVYRYNPQLILFGLSGSELIRAGEAVGLQTANEVFADRTYQSDGSLTPRNTPEAFITDHEQAISNVLRMINESSVQSRQGQDIKIQADTVCIHGDNAQALVFARQIRERCEASGITVRAAGLRSRKDENL
jgi:UPF0271 protein